MDDKDRTQDRIDDFLLDRFDEAELAAFEKELATSEGLESEVRATRLAIDAIELAEDRAIKARLQRLEAGLSGQQAPAEKTLKAAPLEQPAPGARVVQMKQRGNVRRLLAYAAALLLALFAGWYVLNGSQPNPQQLAMDYFEPFDNLATNSVRGDEGPTAEGEAYAAYDDGDYALAADRLTELPASPTNRFYLGQSLLAQEKFSAARDIFRALRNEADFALAPEATYFAALSELGSGNAAAARELLTTVAATAGHPFRAQATELLEDF